MITVEEKQDEELLLSDLGIYELSRRIDELLQLTDQLRKENHQLQARESAWQAERKDLSKRHEMVCTRVESLLKKIKELEQV